MENFQYHMYTDIVFGKGAEKQVAKKVKEYGGTKVMLVYGGGSVKRSGLYDIVVAELNDAGIPLEEIQYINAHATSTPVGDLNEAKAIAEVFGNHRPYVTSTKSQTGHEMWMAGASEVIYSILMMNNGFIAPNLNFEEPDEASALLNIPSRRIETEFDTFLSNSFGFGGTNSSLIIRKFKENN